MNLFYGCVRTSQRVCGCERFTVPCVMLCIGSVDSVIFCFFFVHSMWCDVMCWLHFSLVLVRSRFVFFWIYLMGAFSCVHIEFVLYEWRHRWCVEHFRKHTCRPLNVAAVVAAAMKRQKPTIYTHTQNAHSEQRRWSAMTTNCMPMKKTVSQDSKRAIQMNRMNESAQWMCFVIRSPCDTDIQWLNPFSFGHCWHAYLHFCTLSVCVCACVRASEPASQRWNIVLESQRPPETMSIFHSQVNDNQTHARYKDKNDQ